MNTYCILRTHTRADAAVDCMPEGTAVLQQET